VGAFLKANPDITPDKLNRWDNDPNLWVGVSSNLEWARGNVPALVKAMFANAENPERMDQWDWIKRSIHYAKTGKVLGLDDATAPGMIDLSNATKSASKK